MLIFFSKKDFFLPNKDKQYQSMFVSLFKIKTFRKHEIIFKM